MRIKNTLTFVASLAMVFASCSNQDRDVDGMQNEPLFVSGLNNPHTRISMDGSKWTTNDQVGIFMLENGKTSVLTYPNVLYKASSSDATAAFEAVGTKIYYPVNEAPVDFMAYYPYNNTITDFAYPIALANQSESFVAHDLMLAKANNNGNGYTYGSVTFTFSHKLSKLEMDVVDQEGKPFVITAINTKIKGMNTMASFDLSKEELKVNSSVADITPYIDANKLQAIVMPVTISSAHQVEIIVDGKTYIWDINNDYPGLEVKSGYSYQFQLKVNTITFQIEGRLINSDGNSVTPWGEGETVITDTNLSLPAHEEEDGLVRAFPGAEGGGMFVTGGRGGKVIKVTNLNDAGAGSFRAAVATSGARTIIFEVDGIINLNSNITIKHGDLTIAGQSAPGDGICLKNYSLVVDADNVIIRYIRCRMGDDKNTEADALEGRFHKNIIIDHCSMSWSTDECSSFYANENFTMQWCILSESLRNSVHNKGAHGYGAIWGGANASYHHNLLAHHDSRNPRFDGGDVYGGSNPLTNEQRSVDYRNCVVYNYSNYPAYGGEGQKINFVGNYYKWGPANYNGPDENTKGKKRKYFYSLSSTKQGVDYGYPSIYMGGNSNYLEVTDGNDNGVNANNWNGITIDVPGNTYTQLSINVPIKPNGVTALVTTHTAQNAFEKVLKYSGASYKRDAVDIRVVDETRSGTVTYKMGGNGSINGLVDTPSAVGGYPIYKSGKAKTDSDGDGIPDVWEDAFGLNKKSADDGNIKTLDKKGRYTNLEMYLHYLVKETVNGQVKDGTYSALN